MSLGSITVVIHGDRGGAKTLRFTEKKLLRSKGYELTPKSMATDAPYVITKGDKKIGEIPYSLAKKMKGKKIHVWSVPGDGFEVIPYGNSRDIMTGVLKQRGSNAIRRTIRILRPWVITIASITTATDESGDKLLNLITSATFDNKIRISRDELVETARRCLLDTYAKIMKEAGFSEPEIKALVDKIGKLKSPIEIKNRFEKELGEAGARAKASSGKSRKDPYGHLVFREAKAQPAREGTADPFAKMEMPETVSKGGR